MVDNHELPGKRLKIAILVRRFITTGGMERYCVEVSRRLAREHEVHVFAHEWDWEGTENIQFHKVPSPIKKPNFINQILFSHSTKKLLDKSYDIIHSHERATHFDTLTVHCPSFRSYITEEKRFLPRAMIWLSIAISPRKIAYVLFEKKQFLHVDERVLITVSEKIKKNVQDSYSLPDEYFGQAFPGVDEAFHIKESDGHIRGSKRSELGIEKDEIVILFVGTEFERKGLYFLLKGFALIARPGVKLLIAGGGEKKRKYRKMVEALGIEDKVIFLGLIDDMRSIYLLSDIFILPTLSEPAGMAPLEAMATGLPVIVSGPEYAGCAEQINDGEAVILSNPENPHEIAEALLDLMDEGRRAELGEKGRCLAEKLTWEKTTKDTLSVYNRILKLRESKNI